MNARNFLIVLGGAVFVGTWLVSATATSRPVAAARRTVFSTLKVGQSVTLKEKGGLYEIGTLDEAPLLTHKVAEIGDDYIVLVDGVGIAETRIPVTAVRAVGMLKTKAK